MAEAVADPVADPTPTPVVDAGAPSGAPAAVSDPAAPVVAADPNAPPAEAPKPVEYTLSLPANAKLDAASLERIAATARERGLSQEAAQAAVDLANTEATEAVKASQQALLDAFSPGDPEKGIAPGAEWSKQHQGWLDASLADPGIGNGKKDQLDAKVATAAKAFDKFASPEFKSLLASTGYGSHPEVLRVFAAIGDAMSEKAIVVAGAEGSGDPARERLYAMYPTMRPKD